MDRAYLRPYSPPRRHGGGAGHPGRNSTGLLDTYSSSYDHYRPGPRSSRDSVAGPRSSAERFDQPRRYAPPREAVPVPVARNPGDYEVPLRRHDVPHRPHVVVPADAHEYRPVVRSAVVERPPDHHTRSRPRDDDESYYLMPSSSSRGHHRTVSAGGQNYSQYQGRSRAVPLSPRDRGERVYYKAPRQYQVAPAIRQPRDKEDRDYGYEYTDFKDQTYRDTLPVPRTRTRRESDVGPRERPSSIAGLEDIPRRSSRTEGPPVSYRGFPRSDRDGSVRHEYRYPRGSDVSKATAEDETLGRRRSTRDSHRGSVSLHQDRPEVYAASNVDSSHKKHHRSRRTEDSERSSETQLSRYDEGSSRAEEKSSRHRERRASVDDSHRHRYRHSRDEPRGQDKPEPARRDRADEFDREYVRRRSRPEDAERDARRYDRGEDSDRERRHRRKQDEEYERQKHSHHLGEGAAVAGVAAAAGSALYANHKHRHERQDSDSAASKSKALRDDGRSTKSSRDEPHEPDRDEDPERRERRRLRRRERDERERREASGRDDKDNAHASEEDDLSRQSTRDSQAVVSETRRTDDRDRRGRRHSRLPSESDNEYQESSQARRVRLVSPAKEPEPKPKGILKSPRAKFPEDPAPIREGVAPLKDAGKKGVPSTARWTKIDRRLVNPEALDLGNERYEERNDYVIVLRVLSKEEIEVYAAKTAEIRGLRHREREQMLALDDRAYARREEEEDERPLALDNRPYNEPDVVIPGITGGDRAANGVPPPPVMATLPPPPASAPPQDSPATRPEPHSTNSYVRMPPAGSSSSGPSAYGGPAYPAPPPLKSSPVPVTASPLPNAPGLAVPPSAPPPPSSSHTYPLPSSSHSAQSSQTKQYTYPPPPPPAGTYAYPPPPTAALGPSQPGEPAALPQAYNADTSPGPARLSPQQTSPRVDPPTSARASTSPRQS